MNADWLAQLAPDRAPTAVGWWPPAPGWWVSALALIAFGLALASAIRWWRAPQRRFRRAALRDLRRIRASPADGAAAAQAIERLLRRYALAQFGRDAVARLSGESWLAFARGAGAERLAGDAGRSLLAAAFGKREILRREDWLRAADEFIRRAARSRSARRQSSAR